MRLRQFLLGSLAALALGLSASQAAAPSTDRETPARRLTPEQYAATIADIFGPAIKIGGRFDPGFRIDGLLEVGASQANISPSGMEQYDVIARSIAAQVMDEQRRELMVPCKPKTEAAPDDACAAQFLTTVGELLFRRPLSDRELRVHVRSAREATVGLKDFYQGLGLSLAAMLSEPQFLFRRETFERDPALRGELRLDAYSKASRLSFFLWNSGPDRALLTAARSGELDTADGLARQVERMVASPRLESGVRAFFSDMLHFEDLATLTKDVAIYPKFSASVAEDAREQTLRTIVDVTLHARGDYRDIFTVKKTHLTRALAAIYQVPLAVRIPNGAPEKWLPYEFAADDPRGGVLMQVAFVTLHSHPGRSSPTLRGKALREIFLCQKVPAPPGDVNFTIVQDTSNPVYKTARERLQAHATNPVCVGCHKITDPMGLALENFDGGGSYRTSENGVALDTTGELDGVKFTNGAELGRAVHANPAATSCLVDRMTAYALGRTPARSETQDWVGPLKQSFAKDGYVVPELMRRIATSPEFYRAAPLAEPQKEASLRAPDSQVEGSR
ncbi:MAG: DUF1592 domain-containing protein [Rhodospirillaceae bacterium]